MQNQSLLDGRASGARLWPVLEACYSRTWNEFRMYPHIHDRIEIMYVLKGKSLIHIYRYEMLSGGRVHVTDRHTESLNVGEFILIDRVTMNALEVPESSYMANVEFVLKPAGDALLTLDALERVSGDVAALLRRRGCVLRGSDNNGLLYGALERVIDDFGAQATAGVFKPLHDLHMGELMLILAQRLNAAGKSSAALSYVRQAMRLIEEHMEDALSIQQIAEEVGLSSSYLQRLFKQFRGVTMIEYLNALRIERSKLLLIHTDDSIVDIAVAVGYNSRQHFCRVFTAQVGMSPRKFRQTNKALDGREQYSFDNVRDLLAMDFFPGE